MLERDYQAWIIKELGRRFPGCLVIKNDTAYIQGIPDLTVFYEDKWAALEVKSSFKARHQPNQDYYVSLMNAMSYANFIYPENEEEVFGDLQHALQSCG